MSQSNRILKDLKKGKRITPLSALRDYGCMRLAARILEIQEEFRIKIDREWMQRNNKRFMVYFL